MRSNFLGEPAITDFAGFAQDEIRLGERLKGTIGLRADFHSATDAESETTLNPKDEPGVRAGATTNLRASMARGYRAPSAIEQFVSTRQYGFQVIPNPDLRGEHAWSGEVGITAYPWPARPGRRRHLRQPLRGPHRSRGRAQPGSWSSSSRT